MSSPSRRNSPSSRPLSALLDGIVDPALRRRGFTAGDIVRHWPEIVGETLADVSLPERIRWPKTPADGSRTATLVVRVDGPIALELQHRAPALIERVNTYFGYGAVSTLKIVQGPLPEKPLKARPRACSPDDAARIEVKVAAVGDPNLKAALARLGKSIAAQSQHPLNKS